MNLLDHLPGQSSDDAIPFQGNALANQILSPNLTDYSNSVNTIVNTGSVAPIPLLAPTFTSRDAFKAGQGTQPTFPFQQLNLWFTCTAVIVRLMSNDPGRGVSTKAASEPVVGISVLDVGYNAQANSTADQWLIDTIYAEFNAGAWLVDIGVFKPSGPTS